MATEVEAPRIAPWIEELQTTRAEGTYFVTGYSDDPDTEHLVTPAVVNWPKDGSVVVTSKSKRSLKTVAALRAESGPVWILGLKGETDLGDDVKHLGKVWSPLRHVEDRETAEELSRLVLGSVWSEESAPFNLFTACVLKQRNKPGGSLTDAVTHFIRLYLTSPNHHAELTDLGLAFGIPTEDVDWLVGRDVANELPRLPLSITSGLNYGNVAWDHPQALTLDEVLADSNTTICAYSHGWRRTPLGSLMAAMSAHRMDWPSPTLVVLEDQELNVPTFMTAIQENGADATITTRRSSLDLVPKIKPLKALISAGRVQEFPLPQ